MAETDTPALDERPDLDQLQIDVATAVVRMEQAWAERDTDLGALLLMRLATCDAPRLRGHLTPAALALIEVERADEQVEAASKAVDDWCRANPSAFEPEAPPTSFAPAPASVTVSYLPYDRRIIAYIHRAPDGTETVFKPEEIFILREGTE